MMAKLWYAGDVFDGVHVEEHHQRDFRPHQLAAPEAGEESHEGHRRGGEGERAAHPPTTWRVSTLGFVFFILHFSATTWCLFSFFCKV